MKPVNIYVLLSELGIQSESIESLLSQGIESERLIIEAYEIIGTADFGRHIQLLQAERLLSILRTSRLT